MNNETQKISEHATRLAERIADSKFDLHIAKSICQTALDEYAVTLEPNVFEKLAEISCLKSALNKIAFDSTVSEVHSNPALNPSRIAREALLKTQK